MFQYDGPLDEVDPEIASIIRNEKDRQVCGPGGRGGCKVEGCVASMFV